MYIKVLPLTTCTLRLWHDGDEESLAHHANNRNVWVNLKDRFPHPYTMNDAREWVRRAHEDPNQLNLAIVVDGKAVGGIGVIFLQDVHRHTAELGYWLGEEHWNKGIATEAVKALTEYILSKFHIYRIQARVFDWNGASRRVLEKAGYRMEGRFEKHVTKEGKVADEFLYAFVQRD
jgi:ribosomal-protein-alanine N-acetyltransferase